VSRARRQARWDDETSGRTDFDLLVGLVGFHLRFAQNAVVDHFLEHVGDGSVTPIQFSTLVLVGANPGLSQTTLSRAVGIERSSTVTIIDVLEKRGLVERRRPDRRSHALHLTAAGKRLLAKLEPQVRAHDAAIATSLSDKEKRLLVDMLDRLAVDTE
jgi:DNA-binding MarR family transcriptional regulator